jgi:hypothetical protein
MALLLLSKTIYSDEDKEFSDILNTVDINRRKSPIRLHSQTILNQYKEVSQVLNNVDINKKHVRRKTVKEMMEESFFHGSSWLGSNFIA